MFRRTPREDGSARGHGMLPWVGLAAAGGLLLALAPATAQAMPATDSRPLQRVAPPVVTQSVTAHVHFASSDSYLTWYSQRILVKLIRSIPAGAVVQSTKVVGYVQARTARDNGRVLATARAVEVRAHLRELGLPGRVDVTSGGIAGSADESRQAIVTITYRPLAAQAIAFTQPDDMTVGDEDAALIANSSSGLRVTVRSTTASVCTVVGVVGAQELHAVSPGRCSLVATQPGTSVYRAAAAVARTLTVAAVPVTRYTVSFDARGGSVSPESALWTAGGDDIELPTPTREGYTFDGWFNAAVDGNLAGLAGAGYAPEGDITLYAYWTAVSDDHTVTFHANYQGGPADTTQTSDGPAALTANPFGMEQGTLDFAGWATEAGGAVVYAEGATFDFAADEDLYAVWGFQVDVLAGMGETAEVWYCGRADGQCANDLVHIVTGAQQFRTTIIVFPNQQAGGVLDGFDVKTTVPSGWVGICGTILINGTQDMMYGGLGPVWFDVQSPGHIHLDGA